VPAPYKVPAKLRANTDPSEPGLLLQMATFGIITFGSDASTDPFIAIPQHNLASSPQVSLDDVHAIPTPDVGSGGAGVGVGGAGVEIQANPSAGNKYEISVLSAPAPVSLPAAAVASDFPSASGLLLQIAIFGTDSEVALPSASETLPLVATPQHSLASAPHVSVNPVQGSPMAAWVVERRAARTNCFMIYNI